MNRKMRVAARALALLGVVGVQGAHADEEPSWNFSGFGTVGAVVTNTDEAQFRSNSQQTRGADRSPSFSPDSRIGLQTDVKFNDIFSAVGQLLVRNHNGNDRPQVQWLFGKASVTSWLELRAGRMVLPTFLVSDSLNVGYAAHWARPPGEVYNLYQATAFDGVQAQVRTDWGGTHFTVQASAGAMNVDFSVMRANLSINSGKLYSLNLMAERGDWTVRLGDTESYNTSLKGAGPLPLFTASFRGAGLIYDDGKALLQAEYVTRRTKDPASIVHLDMNAYYVTGGFRMGKWMPYATYSRYEPKRSMLASSGTSPTRTVAAGLRWDAFKDLAIKAQIESAQSNGFNFSNESPAFLASTRSPNSRKVNVFTLLADFVF